MHAAARAGHIAILTAPLPGHLNPVQAVGARLSSFGWRVSVVHVAAAQPLVTHPSIAFAPLANDSDALFASYLAALARPSGPIGLRRMIRATAAMTDRLLADAPAMLERIGATAVLADAVEPAGPLIARRLGLPYAVALTGLPLLSDELVPPPYVGWRFRADAWGRFRNRAGYAVARQLLRPIEAVVRARRHDWGLGDDAPVARVQVAQCPRELDFPRSTLPTGFHYGSPWRLPEQLNIAIPNDARPLIFCSLGTLQGARPDLFATMAAACAAIGTRAVIGHAGGLSPEQEAALPGDPLVRAFWPQRTLLARCTAAILHGGFNSILDALAAGVPIIALPIGFEQPATAARIVHSGAGKVLSPHRLGVGSLACALSDLLRDDSYRNAARRLAAAMNLGDGADGAAAVIDASLTSRA
jgi:UDP:flavonoid glycosyltransferase YjiC (YdhE family)